MQMNLSVPKIMYLLKKLFRVFVYIHKHVSHTNKQHFFIIIHTKTRRTMEENRHIKRTLEHTV